MNESIKEKIQKLRDKIADISAEAGVHSDNIQLVAVSKKQSDKKIIEAKNAGIKYFAENKVQEFLSKFENLELQTEWHFVGHLQTNKVKYLINKVNLIHSVDSLHLAQKISQVSTDKSSKTNILLQVNTSGEESKFGFDKTNLIDNLAAIDELKNVQVLGLMTMAPFGENVKVISNSFTELKKIYDMIDAMKLDNIKMQYLSMGMSNDFEIAIKEGSNMLRIGTSIFGPRN